MRVWVMKTNWRWMMLGICAAAAAWAAGSARAEEAAWPPGMRPDHLNLVLSVGDPDKVHAFYGEILGLERIPDIDFPGEAYMIRYMGGATEIKFIVTGEDLPSMEGGMSNARGIRLMALMLPDERRSFIMENLEEAGLPMPNFTEGENADAGYTYRYGMVHDLEGNQVELVFLDDNAPPEKFEQLQIGLAVSDMDAMGKFLTDVLGYTPTVTKGNIHRYAMGKSQVKFWRVPEKTPAWVGSPFEKRGYNLVQSIVPDVDAVREAVVARGGKIHTEPFPLGQLATIMFVEGPDGILFEFAGPLAARFKQ